jgi:ATP-dependent Clp protease protease subunit
MKKLKAFFNAAKSANGSLDLTMYGDIGEDWFSEGITAKGVKSQIDAAGAVDRISLRINSPGGDAFEGIAISNLLKAQGKPIDVFVDGIAASAASIIAMCGDSITMAPNSMLMIHNAWGVTAGNAADHRAYADVLDRVSAAIANTYLRTGLSKDEIQSMLDAETWMGAEECLEKGFCTAISGEESDEALAMAASFPRLQALRNVPERLKTAAGVADVGDDVADISNRPAQEKPEQPSNLSLYEAQLRLLGIRK